MLVALSLTACTNDPQEATRVLEAQGYTNVVIEGYAFWGCDSNSDQFSNSWRATGVNGAPVKGVICSGWLKGYTVRVM